MSTREVHRFGSVVMINDHAGRRLLRREFWTEDEAEEFAEWARDGSVEVEQLQLFEVKP